MTARILVTYTSRKGSTAEIAKTIGKELKTAGAMVDLAELRGSTTLDGYNAVVIGAPVYMGRFEKDLVSFVARNKPVLEKIPVAAFAVGIAPVYPQIGSVDAVLDELTKIFSPIQLVAITMFAGRLNLQQQSLVMRKLIEFKRIPTGDFRNWDVITAWARRLPDLLKK